MEVSMCVCGCVYVCVYVFAITATQFNLELYNFAITFIMWISKNSFISLWSHCALNTFIPIVNVLILDARS